MGIHLKIVLLKLQKNHIKILKKTSKTQFENAKTQFENIKTKKNRASRCVE